jgi:hypothetical protein
VNASECSHSCSFDRRCRPETLRTAMAIAFFCLTNTTFDSHHLKTAKAFGLIAPLILLATADEVIE